MPPPSYMLERKMENNKHFRRSKKKVDAIGGNVTDAMNTRLAKSVLQQSLARDFVQAAVQAAHDDAELLQEVQADLARVHLRSQDKKDTPEAHKLSVINLNTLLIEKTAKLDSSIVRMRGDLKAPEVDFGCMEGDEKKNTETASLPKEPRLGGRGVPRSRETTICRLHNNQTKTPDAPPVPRHHQQYILHV